MSAPLPPSGSYISSVRESCRALRTASGISIPPNQIEALLRAPALVDTFSRLASIHGISFPLSFPSLKSELNFLATLALLNFASGYREALHKATGRGAYDNIRLLVMGMYIDSSDSLMSARGWTELSDGQIAQLLNVSIHEERAHETIPGLVVAERGGQLSELVGLITRTLKEAGEVLVKGGYSDLGAFVVEGLEVAKGSAEVLVERLVKAIPGFRDMGVVDGQPVYLFKKALFLVHAITLRFQGTSGIVVPDTSNLPVFSDNVLPSMLVHLGILDLSSGPAPLKEAFPDANNPDKITKLYEAAIPSEAKRGSPTRKSPLLDARNAYILRAAAVDACEEIVRVARQGEEEWGKNMTLPELDGWLWSVAKDRTDYRDLPRDKRRRRPPIATMSEEMFGQTGMSSGGLNNMNNMNNMNNDLAKQMSLLTAAGRLRATSASGQQQQAMRNGMAPPVPPNVPGDKQRAQFLAMLTQVLAQRGIALPPFVSGQPNPAYSPDTGPLKNVQPASDNRLGALRLPGAVPGRTGDIDLFKLWSAVTGAGGMQRIQAGGQWDAVANHIGFQQSPQVPGQLPQLYFLVLAPLEEHMKRTAQAKQAQMLAQQQQQQQQQNLTPAQLHQQQQQGMGVTGMQNPGMVNPALGAMQNSALGGMQNSMQNNMGNPALGAMQNPALGAAGLGVASMANPALNGMQNPAAALGGMQNPAAALGGMQNPAALGGMQNPTIGGVMQNNLAGGVMQNNLTGLGAMQMTPAQMHQQQNQQPPLTPAQMHAMQNPASNGPNPGLGVGVGVGVGHGVGGPSGSTMPPPAPVPVELGGKRKSEPDEDEKRAKLKVGDPAPAAATRRTKIEYVPLRLDVETWGGRALDGMMAGIGAQGSMEKNIREIAELGTVDITSITLSLRARTPRSLGYALGILSTLSSHVQQSFPLIRCEDLLDVLVELLESAALEGDGWLGGPLGSEREVVQNRIKHEDDAPVKQEDGGAELWDEQDEEVPIRTHRELVRIAAEAGVGLRARGRGWDGGAVGSDMSVKREDDLLADDIEPDLTSNYGDVAPPGLVRSDVIITIVRLLRNFSIGPDNCQFMARDGSRVVDVLANIIGFREGKETQTDGLFAWDSGVDISISPVASPLNLSQLLRVRKDVLHIIANLGLHLRLNPSSPTPQKLFELMASFLLDPTDTRPPVQLYQHLLPNRRFSLSTEIALDALSRIAHADANRAVFQRTVSPPLLKAVFMALTKMLPSEQNDMFLLIRFESWMAYAERVSLGLYALACSLSPSTRADIRTNHRALGASVLRMMCRMAQYDPSSEKTNTPWAQRSPFVCLVRRVVEALRIIDDLEEEVQVGWPVRGGKLEGAKGSGWLSGIGSDDALMMMSIEGLDNVLFEDLEMLTRVGEVGA
ncbi:unnamed protein product [Rhizoctonia solani]|uniref:Queuosine 5'-phosphate N-glycosylase/hydrolase n=1 Tax=Rhizoctonia solani TaxID=456999 RepID=A0A8H3C806_9AGAM|nr:unnamed protein product [Rhizoctonia solani]